MEGGNPVTEREIIESIRQRDPQGASLLLTYYAPLMRYVISPILGSDHDREECLNDAAMRIWEKIDRFDPDRGSWTAWVTAVARNAALNRVRAAGSREETTELTPDIPSPEPTPEEALLRRERQQELRQALSRLAQFDRLIFYRKYYYLQSTAQIAAETGMTERAVEGRLYRIRKQLRKQLGGDRNV